jgi:translation elongation factor EF-1beta
MKNLKESLQKQEKSIVNTAYKIAIAKQDIALGVVDTLLEVFKKESPQTFSKEKVADLVFQKVKEVPNADIEQYLNASKSEQYKIRLKIEKRIVKSCQKD